MTRRDAESLLVAVNEQVQLHLRHYSAGSRHTTVVLLHDLFSDGSVFFRDTHALAPRLVQEGFDVWVPDLRGHGRSFPPMSPGDDHGFHLAVIEDLGTIMGELRDMVPDKRLFLLGHGTGGLLWLSFMARWPIVRDLISGLVLVGAGTMREPSRPFAWTVRTGWQAGWLARRRGLVPGSPLGRGEATETTRFFGDVRGILSSGTWVDPVDSMDYAARLREIPAWPPTLLLAADADAPWPGPQAARALQSALPPHDGRLYRFPAESGVRLLGPDSALTGGRGVAEVGSLVLDWLAAFGG